VLWHREWEEGIWPVNNPVLHAVNCRRFCFWRHPSVVFLFVYEISPEPLNGFETNSHRRRVWSLARTSLKVKGQGHQGQKWHFSTLSVACVWFVFGKTSLASSWLCILYGCWPRPQRPPAFACTYPWAHPCRYHISCKKYSFNENPSQVSISKALVQSKIWQSF